LENGVEVVKSNQEIEVKLTKVATPIKIEQIRGEMAENVQLVQYTVLPDKVLIWLISKDSFEVFSKNISAEDLKQKSETLFALISQKGDEIEIGKSSAELYSILLTPIIDKLSPDKQICLIPDKFLLRLPFAALVSPINQSYFITERKFFYAPSASVFTILSRNAAKVTNTSQEHVLSIGNPKFDKESFADLGNLPKAELEATEITRFYDSSTILLGNKADKVNILNNLSKSNIVHFAGHYVVNESSPLLSSLILAKGKSKEDSTLANFELLGENLSQSKLPKLIVLSACDTGIEKYIDGEGMIGASRIFLASGIPLVVSSQWAIQSEATEKLMFNFHRYRKTKSFSTANSLRQAQIDLAISPETQYNHPYFWSGFITLGANTEF
jgi:CHAT domain-containing protein